MKRQIVLKEGAPPLEQLRAVLRVDVPYKFDLNNFNRSEEEPNIGRSVENLLDAVNEEMLMLAKGETSLFELMEVPYLGSKPNDEDPCPKQWVLVDDENNVWSEEVTDE